MVKLVVMTSQVAELFSVSIKYISSKTDLHFEILGKVKNRVADFVYVFVVNSFTAYGNDIKISDKITI